MSPGAITQGADLCKRSLCRQIHVLGVKLFIILVSTSPCTEYGDDMTAGGPYAVFSYPLLILARHPAVLEDDFIEVPDDMFILWELGGEINSRDACQRYI